MIRSQVRASAVAHGRGSDDVKVLPGIHPIVGATREEAERKYEIVRPSSSWVNPWAMPAPGCASTI